MKHKLIWTGYADQGCSCGDGADCPALTFMQHWGNITWSLRGMREDFIPMLRQRWAARGDGADHDCAADGHYFVNNPGERPGSRRCYECGISEGAAARRDGERNG